MYVCMCVCMYVCIYVYIYTHQIRAHSARAFSPESGSCGAALSCCSCSLRVALGGVGGARAHVPPPDFKVRGPEGS